MANKQISQLTEASSVGLQDLFVLEQSGAAKKLTGQTLLSDLQTVLEAHGGIVSIAKTSTSGLVDTYTITMVDGATTTFTVTNGEDGTDGTNGTDGVTFTPAVSSAGVISWTNDGGRSNPTPVNIKGDQGEQGDNWYVYIRWASAEPTADADMGTVPDAWMGVYAGVSATAPTHYTDYAWYEVKGATGDAATLSSSVVTYQSSASGTTVPSGTWLSSPPTVPQGDYLWTKTVLTFNSGSPVTLYSVSRMGVDGQGAPATDTPLEDVSGGAVGSALTYARADHQHPLPSALEAYEALYVSWSFSSSNRVYSDARITADSRVISCVFDAPANITSDITWTTATGSVTLTGSVSAATTVHLVIAKVNS